MRDLKKDKEKRKITLDNFEMFVIITFVLAEQQDIAGLCKGSTTDSDSVCEGSNPSPAAMRKPRNQSVPGLFLCVRVLLYNINKNGCTLQGKVNCRFSFFVICDKI